MIVLKYMVILLVELKNILAKHLLAIKSSRKTMKIAVFCLDL